MTSPANKPTGWLTSRKALVGVVVLIVLAGFVRQGATLDTPTKAGSTFQPVAWWPSDFSVTTDPTVAYQWAQGKVTCSLDSCWGMTVIPRDGCPAGLYVEVSITDSAGAAVGYSNDTAGSVQPGQRAQLVFENTEPTGKTARLTDVSCR